MTKQEAVKAAMIGEITNAMAKFRQDLGFTPPELVPMRIDNLEQRLRDAAHRVAKLAD